MDKPIVKRLLNAAIMFVFMYLANVICSLPLGLLRSSVTVLVHTLLVMILGFLACFGASFLACILSVKAIIKEPFDTKKAVVGSLVCAAIAQGLYFVVGFLAALVIPLLGLSANIINSIANMGVFLGRTLGAFVGSIVFLREKKAPAYAAYTAPQAPAYTVPQTPADTVPQTPADTVPQAPAYTAPQAPAYTAPQAPAYTAPQTPANAVPQAPVNQAPYQASYNAYQAPYGAPQVPYGAYQGSGYSASQAPVEDLDGLCAALLNAVRFQLKAPMTAVLCPREQLIIRENGGVYEVEGIVHSQNSYGAMLATDFTATVVRTNNLWSVIKTTVGVKSAKNYAKNFAVNYIVISIFVGIMALIGSAILFAIVGL